MRIVSAIDRPLADEHVIGVDPPLMTELPGVWRRRINPFTGRSLSDRALTAEQEARAGIQRLRGQSVTAGIVSGLDLLLEPNAIGAAPDQARVQILPGLALAQSGEDAIISSPRSIALGDLPVRARVDILDAIAAGTPAPPTPAGSADPDPDAPEGGALAGMFPLLPRRLAKQALGELIAADAAAALPRVAVLVAQPVTATLLAGARDACAPDPRDDPYDDLQLIDGVRLVLDMWPAEMAARAGGPDYSLPGPGAAFRNRLSYRIFDVERRMLPGEIHPWEALGVPLALIGFNPDWSLAFVDRASVVRLGGRPNPRTPLVPGSGNPVLWQARVSQFAEHMASLPDLTPGTLAASLRELPPVGFLPIDVVDLATRRQSFFAAGFGLSMAPMPLEQIDLVIAESASLAPIRMDMADDIELLVPVPERLYEPGLLEIAAVDHAFGQAITRAVGDRTGWLVRREQVRRRRDVLLDGVTGQRPSWPTADTTPDEILPDAEARGPVGCSRVRQISATAGAAPNVLGLSGAGSSLSFAKGDIVTVWAKIVDPNGLTGFSVSFGANSRVGNADFSACLFWGAPDMLPGIAAAGAATLKQGDLPPSQLWVRLDIAADRIWTAAGKSLVGVTADALQIAQRGGTMQWGPIGKIDASGRETVWIADDALPGSRLFDSANPNGGAWTQLSAGIGAAPDPAEDDFATSESGGVRTAAAVEAFRGRWTQSFLAGDFKDLDEGGIDGFVQALDARLKATNDAIDLGFVRARADIYRVRQYMLGADAASRLVTSPSLADLATREEGARAKSLDIASYLKTAYQTDFRRDPDAPLEVPPKRTPNTPSPPPPPVSTPLRNLRVSTMLTQPNFNLLIASTPQPNFGLLATSFVATTARPVTTFAAGPSLAIERTALRISTEPAFSLASLRADQTGIRRNFGAIDVQSSTPLPSAVERTASVAERLMPAPAVEAHGYAIAGKLAVLTAIAGLIGTADAADARPSGIALSDLPAPGYRFRQADDAPAPPAPRNTVGDVIADIKRPVASRLYDDLDDLQDSGANAARHEADYFTFSVKAIDNAIAMMRLIEARVDFYNNLVADARQVRDELIGHVTDADARLRTIGIEIEEARQDFGFATALLAEEQARVDALNARRGAILEANANIVLFRRPRVARRVRAVATAPATAALDVPPIVACKREHPAVPEEIHSFIGLMRDAPVAWFPHVHPQLERIDRLEAVRGALAAVQQRAAQPPLLLFGMQVVNAAPRFLQSVSQVMVAQRSVLEERRLSAVQLDLGAVYAANLANARRVLLDRAALADLIAGDHNRAALAKAAAAEIEQIGDAAACLHDAFGDTPPIDRLQWAELLSEFDRPAPLDDLNGLPGWTELPIALRKTQQGLVDWLFSRVDPAIPAAVTAIHQLVRVCLLMAAHAPVDRIIATRLVAPAPARIGGRLSVYTDVSIARIGMTALVRDTNARLIAHAVVEDLTDGIAHTRIVKTFGAVATIGATARIELSDLRLAL